MKYAQFFETVEFSRSALVAVQDGDKGFKLVTRLSYKNGETGDMETREIVLDGVSGEPRYFKSLASLPEIFREANIMSFTVQLSGNSITKSTRAKRGTAGHPGGDSGEQPPVVVAPLTVGKAAARKPAKAKEPATA